MPTQEEAKKALEEYQKALEEAKNKIQEGSVNAPPLTTTAQTVATPALEVKKQFLSLISKKIPIVDANYLKASKIINSKAQTKQLLALNQCHVATFQALKQSISAWSKFVDLAVAMNAYFGQTSGDWRVAYNNYAYSCEAISANLDLIQQQIYQLNLASLTTKSVG